VFYEEKVRKDFTIKTAQQADYLNKGIEAVDKALELRPDYSEALTYKGLLKRQQASKVEKNAAKQQQLIKEADELLKKALDIRNRQTGTPAPAPAK
jgi:hypothetical protein